MSDDMDFTPEKFKYLDIGLALKRVGNNEQLLGKILGLFTKNHLDDLDKIKQALDANDKKSVLAKTHNIQSVAGNIGAIRLQETAHTLELEIKNDGALIKEKFRQFEEEFNLIVAELNSIDLKPKTK